MRKLVLSLAPTGKPRWNSGKECTCQCRRCRRHGLDPWVGVILWSGKWQPAPVILPGKFHGQRSLESSMNRGGWWSVVHGATKSQLWLNTQHMLMFSRPVMCNSLWSHRLQQASLSLTISWSLPKFMSIASVMPSHPLLPSSPSVPNLSQHQGLFQWVKPIMYCASLICIPLMQLSQ